MEDSNLKLCKMCYQKIDLRARKCPFCHHWQNRIDSVLFHPAIAVLPFAFVFIIVPLMMRSMFDPGESFDKYKDQVKITNSQMVFGQTDCGQNLVILGTFKNNSDVSWKDIQLEARFFDHEGRLIDTGQKNEYFYILQENSEAPFKFSMKKEFPTEKYVTYSISVLNAKDAKAMF